MSKNMAQNKNSKQNNKPKETIGLSGTQKALVIIPLCVYILVMAAWVYVKFFFASDNEETIGMQSNQGYMKMTKGSDISDSDVTSNNINMDALKGFTDDSYDYSSDTITATATVPPIDNSEMYAEVLKEKKEELVAKSTDNNNWYYGTLNIAEDAPDSLVIFDYTEFAETPAAVMLYFANENRFYESTKLNDDESGEVLFEMPLLKKGTYGIYIKEAYSGQDIGSYRVYTMPKEDYDNMMLYEDGILMDDDEDISLETNE